MFRVILLLIIINSTLIQSWNLTSIKEITTNYTIRHVSVYYMRSFLCIESVNKVRIPTLIETTWPENIIPVGPRIFPSVRAHAKSIKQCDKIQKAISTDIDRKGKLWIIDNGSKYCPPKLLIYTILPWNERLVTEQISCLRENSVSSIICDPLTDDNGSIRAYISLYDKDYLMIFSLNNRKWWKLSFRNNLNVNQRFQPSEIAFGVDNTLFLSNYKSGELYSVKLSKIRNYDDQKSLVKVPIKYLGKLLGPVKGLITDPRGYLYYILPKDGAVVRWNPMKPLTAEKHDILYQISSNITQIMFGTKGSVWIVTATPVHTDFDELSIIGDHCIRILIHYSAYPYLQPPIDEPSYDSDY